MMRLLPHLVLAFTLAVPVAFAAPAPSPTPTAAVPAARSPVRPPAANRLKPPLIIQASNPELQGLPPDQFYRNLSVDLAPYMGMPHKQTSKYDKIFSAVGQGVEAACAAIAAYQAYQSFAPSNGPSAPSKVATPPSFKQPFKP